MAYRVKPKIKRMWKGKGYRYLVTYKTRTGKEIRHLFRIKKRAKATQRLFKEQKAKIFKI